jgi:hypothetical protein
MTIRCTYIHDTAGPPPLGRQADGGPAEPAGSRPSLVAHDAHRLIRPVNPPNLLGSQLKLATPNEIIELLETRGPHDRSRDGRLGKTPCESDLRHGDVSGLGNGLDDGDDGLGRGGEGSGVGFAAIGGDFGVGRAAEDCEGEAKRCRGEVRGRQCEARTVAWSER